MWNRRSAAASSASGPAIGEHSDERLVEGLRSRAPDAFADLHDRYAPGIYGLALRMVRRGEDAEDITQDVLIRAFEHVPREREVMLRPWLYRLTVNRCCDHLRAAARRGHDDRHDSDALVDAADPFERAAQGRLLEAALRGLTKRQRAALLLKDVHGLTTLEVASALELTPGSVEVLLARSRNAFRTSYVRLCRAEDMPAPSTAGAVRGLGLLLLRPLPASLTAPFKPPFGTPPTLAATDPGLLPALDLAVGGLGAALGTSSVVKVAAALLAVATLAGASPGALHKRQEWSPRATPVVASVDRSPSAGTLVVAPGGAAGAAKPATAVPSPAPDPTAPTPSAIPAPSASPSVSASPAPAPTTTPLGALPPSPGATPAPSATPAPDPTPSATPTPTVSPSSTVTPSPSPTNL